MGPYARVPDELQAEVSLFAGGYRRSAKMKKQPIDQMRSLAGHWERYTAMYDRINEPLPDRYQKRLEDRFYPVVLDKLNQGEAA